jgi:hypothetical protein
MVKDDVEQAKSRDAIAIAELESIRADSRPPRRSEWPIREVED